MFLLSFVKRLLVLFCLFLLTFSLSCSKDKEAPKVNRVIDGDTIDVYIGTDIQRVRLIGINTPEIGQPYAHEATEALKDLVLKKEVRLEKDISETDRYGRLLRYVYVSANGGEIFVNEEMVRNGYAQVMTIPPDVKYTSLFVSAQREAQEAKRGLWGEAPKPQPEDNIVYITKTGKKYHRAGCRYLTKSATPINKSEAIASGYTPCSVCKPDP